MGAPLGGPISFVLSVLGDEQSCRSNSPKKAAVGSPLQRKISALLAFVTTIT
jgi:hypothetical protein